MIDLHTHTTASDGRCAPADLVARAAGAGVTVLAVTDHDTVAGCGPVAAAAARAGIEFVPGIEITAVRQGADVHVLGYFIDPGSAALHAFLARQRESRADRVRRIVDRLATLGMPLDAEAILAPVRADDTKAPGRPWIARALVDAGFVASAREAFERWLGRGCPAFIPRHGAPPEEVFERIHEAGGIASLAHPGLMRRDEWIAGFAAAGLDALEVYHTEHDADATARYGAMAAGHGLLVSGGSDFHGDESHGAPHPGAVTLPLEEFERLSRSAVARRGAPPPPAALPPLR